METIEVTSCDVAHQGTGKNGKPYTIYKLTARDASGQPISGKLKSFKQLPIGEPIEVEIEDQSTQQYGAEYLIEWKGSVTTAAASDRPPADGAQASGDLDRRLKILETRVEVLENLQKARDEIPF